MTSRENSQGMEASANEIGIDILPSLNQEIYEKQLLFLEAVRPTSCTQAREPDWTYERCVFMTVDLYQFKWLDLTMSFELLRPRRGGLKWLVVKRDAKELLWLQHAGSQGTKNSNFWSNRFYALPRQVNCWKNDSNSCQEFIVYDIEWSIKNFLRRSVMLWVAQSPHWAIRS